MSVLLAVGMGLTVLGNMLKANESNPPKSVYRGQIERSALDMQILAQGQTNYTALYPYYPNNFVDMLGKSTYNELERSNFFYKWMEKYNQEIGNAWGELAMLDIDFYAQMADFPLVYLWLMENEFHYNNNGQVLDVATGNLYSLDKELLMLANNEVMSRATDKDLRKYVIDFSNTLTNLVRSTTTTTTIDGEPINGVGNGGSTVSDVKIKDVFSNNIVYIGGGLLLYFFLKNKF